MTTQTIEQKIMKILNPVRLLKVEDWRKIADASFENKKNVFFQEVSVVELISRFESLTSQPLTKEMLKTWFEGFTGVEGDGMWTPDERLQVDFRSKRIYIDEEIIKLSTISVFDFIYEISHYNRTAKEKINLNWTENFIRELIK